MGEQSNFIDITGQTFNELTAIEVVDSKKRLWLWKCSCGKTCIARKNDVTSGKKKSCGHLSNRGNAQVNIGDKFNEWTVLEDIGNRKFRCLCSCGKEGIVHSYDLRKGNSKSCGHLTKGTSKNGRKQLEGTQIGDWSIQEYLGDGYYKCVCSCGKVKKLKGTYLRTGQSKSCGHDTNSFKDLTNKTFEEWQALEFLGDYKWRCKCSCGKEGIVCTSDLINGTSKSCGHNKIKHFAGEKIGNFTLLEKVADYKWKCRCKCGTVKEYDLSNILNGSTKSCGCLAAERNEEMQRLITNTVNSYIVQKGYLPFYEEIAEAVGVSDVTIKKYAKELDIEGRFNKKFGSKAEKDIFELCSKYCSDVINKDRTVLNGKELDIYIPSKKIAIEYNGIYWHREDRLGSKYHQDKSLECLEKGIRLIHIFEYEWVDSKTRDKLETLIIGALTENERIFARKCSVIELDSDICKSFCNKYHLQGAVNSSVRLGLVHNNKLYGVMTFGKPRFSSEFDYEIYRLCWYNNVTVIGGAEKLFKYFIEKYTPSSVISYSDLTKFNGNIYKKLGFKLDKVTEPNYVWANIGTHDIISRYNAQKHILIENGLGTEEQTETEIMQANNYIKIYNSGNLRFIYERDNNE